MQTVYIAEKPSVARAIAAVLGRTGGGEGYIECGNSFITWCTGHILEMAEPHDYDPRYKTWREEDLPFIPTDWRLNPKEGFAKQLALMGKALKTADRVVHAGDPDREGQLLVEEVLERHEYSGQVLRYWANAVDPTSVRRALDALTPNTLQKYRGMSLAARARGRADQLIGVNFSRAYTLRAKRGGSQALLTVGRVQTPTLAMVVERDRAIETFNAVSYYSLAAVIQHADGPFKARWKPRDGQPGLDSDGRLIDKELAKKIVADCTGQYGTVREFKHEPKVDLHPRTYSLSDIALAASQRHGISASDALAACQSLYEIHKLTTYPRTDCAFLPEVQHSDAAAVFSALRRTDPRLSGLIDGADASIKSKTWDSSKVTAHHGIIPTQEPGDLSKLNDAERKIYELIVRAYLAQFYPAHEYMSTVITVEVQGESFVASGRTVTKNGWKDVYQADDAVDDEADEDGQSLPHVREGARVKCEGIEAKSKKTKPPARFTDVTLIKAMENIYRLVTDPEERKLLRDGEGIGTPATRTSIIAELKRRGFLAEEKRYLVSTALGRGLIAALPREITSPSLTAYYERMLQQIEDGAGTLEAFLAEQINFVRAFVRAAGSGSQAIAGTLGPTCPTCGEGNLRRVALKDNKGHFWSCSRYADGCKASYEDKAGKPDIPTKTYACTACGKGVLRKIKTANGVFWGCTQYAEGCKASFADSKGKPVAKT